MDRHQRLRLWSDGRLAGTTKGAAPEAFVRQQCEPTFDLIDPRGSGGCEM
jgi:hypothetical protein